jgi:ankyrin repeat protein
MAVNGFDADLFDAVEFGDIDYFNILTTPSGIGDDPVDINAQDNSGVAILMIAARYGHTELLRLILEHGANPQLKDNVGKTALDWAANSEQKEAIEILRQAVS